MSRHGSRGQNRHQGEDEACGVRTIWSVIKRVREMEWEKGKYGDHTFMEWGEGRAFTSEGLLPCLSYLDVSV